MIDIAKDFVPVKLVARLTNNEVKLTKKGK